VRAERCWLSGGTYKQLEDETDHQRNSDGHVTESAKFTYVIPAGVVIVMVRGETGDDFDTEPLGG